MDENTSNKHHSFLSYIQTLCDPIHQSILFEIITFLPYPDLINFKLTSNQLRKSIGYKAIKYYAQEGCIDEKYRKDYYKHIINYSSMKTLIMKELISYKIPEESLFTSILSLAEIEKTKSDRVYFKICEEIGRDLDRTFYTEKFVKGNGRLLLKHVLNALGFIRPEIGYCQGMNFIGGALINFLDDDEFSFWVFLALIDDLELNLLYLRNMPDYSIRVFQLNYYINKYMPDLLIHFNKNQINPDIFLSKWILTIFSSYLPFETLAKVWDVFLIDKWKAIFKFSLSFLTEIYRELIQMDLNTLSQYFRDHSRKIHFDYRLIKNYYSKFKITNKELDQLREDFFTEQVKIKLEDPLSIWEPDQDIFVIKFKNEIESIDNATKKQTKILQERIENANKKHVKASNSYEKHRKACENLKLKVQLLIDKKLSYDNVDHHLSKVEVIDNIHENFEEENAKYNINKKEKNNSKSNNNSPSKVNKKEKDNVKGNAKENHNNSMINGNKPLKEMEILNKKNKKVTKEIEDTNAMLFKGYKKLDNKKYNLEQIEEEKAYLKKTLDNLVQTSEKSKRELLINLSQKLKLSIKFVKTSKF